MDMLLNARANCVTTAKCTSRHCLIFCGVIHSYFVLSTQGFDYAAYLCLSCSVTQYTLGTGALIAALISFGVTNTYVVLTDY